MKITLERLNQAVHFVARNEEGNTMEMDGSPEIGGEGKGVRPLQTLLMGLAGCSSIDVVTILQKMRQPLDDIKVTVSATRRENEVPSIFETIQIDYQLYGDLQPDKAQRAVELSMEKYCSVTRILEKTATINYSFSINPA